MASVPRSERFLRACKLQPVDVTPIWLMRQAGRSLPGYRRLRRRHSFKEVSSTPELCAEVTLMPLEELDVDAAIIFADIMTPVACLGVEYHIIEGSGPRVPEPIRTTAQAVALDAAPAALALPELFEAMRLVAGQIQGQVPLIGFAGAPFTLGSYLVEGRPDPALPNTRALLREDPGAWHALMERLTAVLVDYLHRQVEAGARALQLFDSWAGRLTRSEYRSHALPYSTRIFSETAGLEVPRIHFATGNGDLLELMAEPDPEVIGVDWRLPLDAAWERSGYDRAIQGNLDPAVLLGGPDQVVQEALAVLDQAGGRPGHIFNLGHGVLPETPLENLKLLVETVHGYRRR